MIEVIVIHGVTMFGLWWELRQQRQIAEARTTAERTSSDVGESVRGLRTSVEKLILLNRALWEILSEASGLDDKVLEAKIRQIEATEAARAAEPAADARSCLACGRAILQGHRRCSWCGALDPNPDPFAVPR